MINRGKLSLCILAMFGLCAPLPLILAYSTPPSTPDYEFIDTSVSLEDAGINSFAAYQSEDGISVIGGSRKGMFVYRLWGNDPSTILTNSSGQAPTIYDLTDWANSPYTPNPSVLAVTNRTPIVIERMTEDYWTHLFSINAVSIDDEVLLSSSPDTTFTYVAYRQDLYVYNHRGGQISVANLTTLGYASIESLDSGSDKLVVTTPSGLGVFDPIENSTIANLGSPGEVYRTRPAVACDTDCVAIYVGRKDGLHIYSLSEKEFIEVDYLTKHQGLPADSVTSLWLDHAARKLYVGTEGGLIAYDTVQEVLIRRPLYTSEIRIVFSESDMVFAATESGVYVLEKDELENRLSFWEATSVVWIDIYLPVLAFYFAWFSLMLQLHTKMKATKAGKQTGDEERT